MSEKQPIDPIEQLYRTILADDIVDRSMTSQEEIESELAKRFGGEAVAEWLSKDKK